MASLTHRFQHLTLIVAVIFVMLATMVGGSCSTDECFENKNSLPLAGFYSSEPKPQKLQLDRISVIGIGAPGDSVLHDAVSGLSETYLPFRIDSNQTIYEIRYLTGVLGQNHVADFITFNYEIIPWFVSSACGVVYDYKITSIETTHNVIDSVTCPSGTIDNKNIENLKIYFRVTQDNDTPEEEPEDEVRSVIKRNKIK